jgi:hypothetical protein
MIWAEVAVRTCRILQRLKTHFKLSSDIALFNTTVLMIRTLSQGKSQILANIHASVRIGTNTAVPRTRRIIR